ncbi:Hypothetical protein I5071_35740 [Sandaracinus amylolyticus]|nr:Hypothetical protein I5071_35740 [Sandaracinus amylolyticus]
METWNSWTLWAPGDGYGWRLELHERETGGIPIDAELVIGHRRSWLVWRIGDAGKVLRRVSSASA